MELVNLRSKFRIESILFKILHKNKFNNIFKDISNLNEFCDCYIIIEEERLKINKILEENNFNYCQKIKLLKNNVRLVHACNKRQIYLQNIVNNWDFYREKLNKFL